MKNLLLLFTVIMLIACSETEIPRPPVSQPVEEPCRCDNPIHGGDYIYYQDGEKWLWGGQDQEMDFKITNSGLSGSHLKSGLGREFFKALVNPELVVPSSYPYTIAADAGVVVLKGEDETKVYTLGQLSIHEVINETINGDEVMVTYCPLAGLIAVYSRNYCNTALTFALSGYTHYQEGIWEGKDGFVLWDRNTESLWWPLINKSVSGDLKGQSLELYDQNKWELSTYGEVVNTYGNDFKILPPNQTLDLNGEWNNNLAQPECGG